jgi:hypothetical protein
MNSLISRLKMALAPDCEHYKSRRNFMLLQTVSKRLNQFTMRKLPTPLFGYTILSVVGTRDLTIDSPGCIRIVTQIYGKETAITK